MVIARFSATAGRKSHQRFSNTSLSRTVSRLQSSASRLGGSEPDAPTDASIRRTKTKLAQREFFQTVLGASATRRDTKNFRAKFDQKEAKAKVEPLPTISPSNARVNLGELYHPNKAVTNSPQFSFKDETGHSGQDINVLNLVIVKVFEPHQWSPQIQTGVAKTLAQLAKLGLRIAVVIDSEAETPHFNDTLQGVYRHCRDFTDVLNDLNESGARLVDQSFSRPANSDDVEFFIPTLLLSPLRQGAIVVIPPLAHDSESRVRLLSGNRLVLALTTFLAGERKDHQLQWPVETSLDRIIFLDVAGGIVERSGDMTSHIFVNIQQDFDGINQNLNASTGKDVSDPETTRQIADLQTIRKCLALLPATASALLATPLEIAMSSNRDPSEDTLPGVSTRPQRNTLIHNILTDKPLVSSSLPAARLHGPSAAKPRHLPSTFFKYGMPVSIVPGTKDGQWSNPGPAGTSLDLRADPRIDLPKLVHLVEDSFGRKLDIDSYLHRIQNHVAGIIVVGDYEGGAILTWEKPVGRSDDRPLVPYLDKFAVLRRCQGSGGVADIVFNAMVRQCFPYGVVWRSRRDNPVNKWYFERSSGTWDLPDSRWTMFWTGNEVSMGPHGTASNECSERWKDYVAVCGNIQPSWADRNGSS